MAEQELGTERVNYLWAVAWSYQGDECRVPSEDLEQLFMPRLLGNHVARRNELL